MKETIAAVESALLANVEAGADSLGCDSPWLRFQSWKLRKGSVSELRSFLSAPGEIEVGAHESLAGHLAKLWELEGGDAVGWDASDVQRALKDLANDADRLMAAFNLRATKPIDDAKKWAETYSAWTADYNVVKEFASHDSWFSAGFTSYADVQAQREKLVKWEKVLQTFKADIIGPPITPDVLPDVPGGLPVFGGGLALGAAAVIGIALYLRR